MFENGMEVMRMDCHLHTRKDKEFKYNGEENSFVTMYVDKLEQANIRVGIITNHNKFDLNEYKAIKKAAAKKDIFILPGVELSIKEGAGAIHTIIVFNPEEWVINGVDNISRVVDSLFLSIDNPGDENTHCQKDLLTVIDLLDKQNKDYFIIFAHVEQKSGFWEECNGNLIEPLSQKIEFKRRVLGFQKVRTRDKARKVQEWMGYNIAYLEGSDPKSLDEIGKGEKSYIKIGEYNYASVKYAIKDYENRVFLQLPNKKHNHIVKVECIGGKLEGEIFLPSAELNTLIGIRGSGKSSLLEIIRYGLGIDAGKPDKEYKDSLVKNVLGPGGKVIITIEDIYGKKYLIKRIYGENPTVENDDGMLVELSISSLISNPLYFGQKDLALTRAGYEMELLEKISGADSNDISSEIDEINKKICEEVSIYREIAGIPTQIEELNHTNATLQHKLTIFKEKGIDEKLKKQTACNEDLVKLKSVKSSSMKTVSTLQNVIDNVDLEAFHLDTYNSEYNKEIFDKAKMQASEFEHLIQLVQRGIDTMQEKAEDIEAVEIELEEKINSLREEFAEIKREIKDDSIDVDNYVIYQNQLASNNEELKTLKKRLSEKTRIEDNILKLKKKRNDLLKREFDSYENSVSAINNRQNQLHISMTYKGDRELFRSQVRELCKGARLSDIKLDEILAAYEDMTDLVLDVILVTESKLSKITTPNAYAKILENLNEEIENYLNYPIKNDVKINYHGKPLSKHSLGQRASALILFILTQNESDLIIIDQPEDDLDNQVIYEELVKTIRLEKANMQFIFATHNPNIPVLGDAEKIVRVDYNADEEKIELQQGNIDDGKTHDSIVDIMEGGKEAFDMRNKIYITW